MKVFQSTLFYIPITGGQEVYVSKLSSVASLLGDSNVVQPRYGIGKKKEVKDGINISYVNLPRGLARLNELFPYLFFKFLFKFFYKKNISQESKLIYHYSSLYIRGLHPIKNTIVISHGRDWNSKTWSGRYKIKSLMNAFNDGVTLVCNDLDVPNFIINNLGINAKLTNDNNVYKNLIYLPNCYEASLFKPNSNKKREYILMVRNIRKSRGLNLAIKGYSNYVKSGGLLDFKIVGGPLTGKYYTELQNLIKDQGLSKRVYFEGVISRDKMPALYENAALSIVPSLAYEGTSISALESMASGCACLPTRVGGLNDLPTIKFDDEADLGLKIKKHLNDDPLKVAKTVEKFSSEVWGKKWEEILKQTE
jgi:glycosyltransferase involved in cell wall biosynthesis